MIFLDVQRDGSAIAPKLHEKTRVGDGFQVRASSDSRERHSQRVE